MHESAQPSNAEHIQANDADGQRAINQRAVDDNVNIVQAILEDGEYTRMRKERYASFDIGKGRQFEQGKLGLDELRTLAMKTGEPKQLSGKQEYYENLINKFI